MSDPFPRIKVALIGPKGSGKSQVANQLSGGISGANYDPTAGARILVFDKDIVMGGGGSKRRDRVRVELWDCSGDQQYEACWPAITKDLHGIAVVFDPTSKAQANEVRIWCQWFAKKAKLSSPQCVIFAHGNLSAQHRPLVVKLGSGDKVEQLSIPIVNVSLPRASPDESSTAEVEFVRFLSAAFPKVEHLISS